jgi:hypothetical protein
MACGYSSTAAVYPSSTPSAFIELRAFCLPGGRVHATVYKPCRATPARTAVWSAVYTLKRSPAAILAGLAHVLRAADQNEEQDDA